MTVYTLADLSSPQAVATVRARIASALTAAGVPVASWPPSSTGGVENLRLDTYANVSAALSAKRIAMATTMRILPLAVAAAEAELAAGPSGPAMLGLRKLGRDFYRLPWRDATFTVQNIRLSTFGTPGAYTFNPGDLWVRADATGNRYNNLNGGTLNPGQTLDLMFQAENAGSSYADVAGTITTMVTARAGVICNNVAPADFTAARSLLGSSGTFVAAFTEPGVPPPFPSIRVKIATSGDIGSAYAQYTTDAGVTWHNFPGTLPGLFVIPGGATLSFSNGTSPSFIVGDVITVFLGDCILQRGADPETPTAYGARISNRYPALSPVPTAGAIDLWAHQASQEVDRLWSDADPNTPGGTILTIASASGPASAQAQVAVEDYISARLNGYKGVPAAAGFTTPEESIVVTTAVKRNIIPQGVAYVPRAKLTAVQQAAEGPWLKYLRGIPLGGHKGAFVSAAKLEQVLSDAGVTDWQDVLVGDGLNAYVHMNLNPGEVAVMAAGHTLANSMQWVPT